MSRAVPVQDPRIAPKEMIITRFKSAQQRKQQERGPAKTSKSVPQAVTKLTPKIAPQTVTKVTQTVTKVPQTTSKSPQTAIKVSQTQSKVLTTVTKVPQTKSPVMVKSVTKTKPPKKSKPQKCPVKSKEVVQEAILIEDDNVEYYPEKLKRAPGQKKVFLKPKQKSTVVVRTNKRKFNSPKRGIKSPLPNTSHSEAQCPSRYSELSMAEVIQMVEENDSLDEEDLMEILTCPSPVWWEEPPDEMYIEEAIFSRKPEEMYTTGQTKSPIRERCLNTLINSKLANKIHESINTILTEKVNVPKDDKFLKKSKKLENVLGNIRNKVSKDVDVVDVVVDNNVKDDTLQCNIEESTTINDNIEKSSKTPVTNDVTNENVKNIDQDNIVINEFTRDIKFEKEDSNQIQKSTDNSDSINDLSPKNQLLLDLENMNIPIDKPDLNSPDCVIINDDNANKIIDIDALDSNDRVGTESENVTETSAFVNIDNTIQDLGATIKKEIEESRVPKNMPPLTKRPKLENQTSPTQNSFKSISDDVTESSSISGVDIMDTISDTNIKFITDDDIDDSDGDSKRYNDEGRDRVTIKESNDVVKHDDRTELDELAILTNIKDTKSKDSYITVYKIVTSDEATSKSKNIFKNIPEYSSFVENLIQSDTKVENVDESLENDIPDIPIETKGLNSFFKKCKNANRKRKRNDNQDKNDADSEVMSPKKSITVAQEENVKYCMKCSSIFDTEDCSYCLKNIKAEKVAETNFTCDKCDFVGETTNVDRHLEQHNDDHVKT